MARAHDNLEYSSFRNYHGEVQEVDSERPDVTWTVLSMKRVSTGKYMLLVKKKTTKIMKKDIVKKISCMTRTTYPLLQDFHKDQLSATVEAVANDIDPLWRSHCVPYESTGLVALLMGIC